MSFYDYLKRFPERGLKGSINEAIVGVRRRNKWLESKSTNVLDDNSWEVLLILDACRVDLMKSVSNEYEFINEIETIYSVGATSPQWMENTFTDSRAAELNETTYITGNPHTDLVSFPEDELYELDEVWKYGWDDRIGTVPPRHITDRTIRAYQNSSKRIIAHYMQPHVPFINNPEISRKLVNPSQGYFDGNPTEETVWEKLKKGKIKRSDIWEAYRKNLKIVLDDVNLVRNSIDATIVVSSDHGNAMGEMSQYGHSRNTLVDSVCKVPWIKIEGKNTSHYEPEFEKQTQSEVDTDIEERLEELGYRL